jgi:hypothetical protein
VRAPSSYLSAVDAAEHEAPDELRGALLVASLKPVRWSQTLQALATPGGAGDRYGPGGSSPVLIAASSGART